MKDTNKKIKDTNKKIKDTNNNEEELILTKEQVDSVMRFIL